MKSSLSGVRDADIEILMKLDYPSLLQTCQTDQYLRSICQDDTFWSRKLVHDYGVVNRTHTPTFTQEYEYYYYDSLNPSAEAIRGNFSNVVAIWTYTGKLPKQSAVNMVANNRDLRMLQWLAQKGILPDAAGASFALNRRDWPILEWLASQGVYPSPEVVTRALRELDPVRITWLLQKGIKPGIRVFTEVRDPQTIDLLISYGIKPRAEAMALWGNLYALRRSLEYEQPSLSNLMTAAAKGGNLETVRWLANQGAPLSNFVLHAAVEAGHLPLVKWFEQQGVRLDVTNANSALRMRDIQMLNHFTEQGLYPDQTEVFHTLQRNDPAIDQWIQGHGLWW